MVCDRTAFGDGWVLAENQQFHTLCDAWQGTVQKPLCDRALMRDQNVVCDITYGHWMMEP